MSKSLGNLVLVSQALERAPAAAVRLYLASHRYRRDWSFDWSGLAKMALLVERIRVLLEGEVRGAGAPRPGVVEAGAGPGVRRGGGGGGGSPPVPPGPPRHSGHPPGAPRARSAPPA